MTTPAFPGQGFLNDDFRLAYFSAPNIFGPNAFSGRGGKRKRRFFQGQFEPINDLFLGELGSQARSDEFPGLQGTDFLRGDTGFNPNNFFFQNAASPQTGRFNPRTRFIFNR